MVKKQDNTQILYAIIAVLVVIVVGLIGYFLGQSGNSSRDINPNEISLVAEAGRIGMDTDDLQECISENKYVNKINSQMKVGADTFGITGTPGNVLINNETGEYEVISGAYPTEAFVGLIDRLLSDKKIEEDESVKKDFTVNTNENVIVIITDKRDSTPTDQIIQGLKQIESIKNMTIENYDFSDNGVSKYLKENKVANLPAIVFAKKSIDPSIDQFLEKLGENSYSLNIGAKFNPFSDMSQKGFKIIDKTLVEQIKKNSYIDGNKNAKITWLEYSDLECPYCAKLHNSDVESTLKAKYSNDLNMVFNHFPLAFHKKAIPGANILECVGEQGGSEAFYKIMRYAFKNEIQE